jgi:hypothetical protein
MQEHELASFAKSELIDAVAELQRAVSPKLAIENVICATILFCEIVFDRPYSVPHDLFELLIEDPDKLKKLFDTLGVDTLDEAISAVDQLTKE